MSPVLSTMSGLSARAFGFGYNFASSAFEHIETQTVGAGGAASITFNTIPGTYKHLQIRATARGTADGGSPLMRFNGDTGSNYAWHRLSGYGANPVQATASPNQTSMTPYGFNVGFSATYPFGMIIDILDYTATTKNKTVRSLCGLDTNGGGEVGLASGVWMSTNAITSITLLTNGTNYAQYATFSLYGVK